MKQYLKAVKWEVILDLKEYARYRMGLVMVFVVFTGMFIAIYYFGVNSGFASFYHVDEAGGSILKDIYFGRTLLPHWDIFLPQSQVKWKEGFLKCVCSQNFLWKEFCFAAF